MRCCRSPRRYDNTRNLESTGCWHRAERRDDRFGLSHLCGEQVIDFDAQTCAEQTVVIGAREREYEVALLVVGLHRLKRGGDFVSCLQVVEVDAHDEVVAEVQRVGGYGTRVAERSGEATAAMIISKLVVRIRLHFRI